MRIDLAAAPVNKIARILRAAESINSNQGLLITHRSYQQVPNRHCCARNGIPPVILK